MDDPRDRVTEQAFRVDPELLGIPLASPIRRLVAFGLDLLLAAFLAETLGGLVVFAFAFLFFRSARRRPDGARRARWMRRLLVGAGLSALLAGIFMFALGWLFVQAGGPRQLAELVRAARTSTAGSPGRALVQELQRRSEGTLTATQAEAERLAVAVDRALSSTTSVDAKVSAVLEALEDLSDRERVAGPSAATTATAALEARIRRLEATARSCEEEQTSFDPFGFVGEVLSTLGLTFSWIGVYFTGFVGLFGGRTPAKRLLGMRIVRLDGAPFGLWAAFERFSGYGVGLATGLLGFLQIFWDPNRQAIHDRILSTVVIRTDRPRLDATPPPGPGAPAEP